MGKLKDLYKCIFERFVFWNCIICYRFFKYFIGDVACSLDYFISGSHIFFPFSFSQVLVFSRYPPRRFVGQHMISS